ncbi:death domain-associated protein 6 [Caloenas nicobarica]|uniref:death domain-associated protein 6 n=1 Tax=Caloenas nicobarica TaxID=187106 RepID=UPI0032B750AA
MRSAASPPGRRSHLPALKQRHRARLRPRPPAPSRFAARPSGVCAGTVPLLRTPPAPRLANRLVRHHGGARCPGDTGGHFRSCAVRGGAGRRRRRREERPEAGTTAWGGGSPKLCDVPAPLNPQAGHGRPAPPSGVIVLDEDDEGTPPPPPPPGDPPGPSAPPGSPGTPQSVGRGGGGYRAENERLFGEFLDLCARLTEEHPEVVPFLSGRHQKAAPDFLASAEFRNILSRCLSRVRARRNKVYVYINELCTVLKAHTLRRKVPLLAAPSSPASPRPPASPQPPASPPSAAAAASSSPRPPGGSKRQIRYLENLLRVYTGEIRRLQERELDLAELDSADSTYLQESRLKRKMMRIFERLCQLKRCSSLTGRVIEQRIHYRGTRYPEVNRRIERFINRPDAFPDYGDILKVIQKASARHGLGLAPRQMESMAQDAFREVGNRLQERRHLDLVYNFGSHLTDQYRPGTDPALGDPVLAKRLRRNRWVALTRLDGVIAHFAQLQDESEEEERGRRRGARQRGPPGTPPRTAEASGKQQEEEEDEESEEDDEEQDEDEDEEDEEEDEDEEQEEEEEEAREQRGAEGRGAAAQGAAWSPPPPAEEEEEEKGRKEPPELFVLEIETCPVETPPPLPSPPKTAPPSPQPSEPPPPPPACSRLHPQCDTEGGGGGVPPLWGVPPHKGKRPLTPPDNPQPLENGGAGGGGGEGGGISSTSLNGGTETPPRKRSCLDPPRGGSPPLGLEEQQPGGGPGGLSPLPPRSPLPDSTRADSPGRDLVSSSQGSPPRDPPPGSPPPAPKVCKTSVATQCDPEEIIVLSDSD